MTELPVLNLPPLHLSASLGDLKGVRALLDAGEDINARLGPEFGLGAGNTALMGAVLHNQRQVVRLLIKRGADVDVADGRGATVLHDAIRWAGLPVVRLLLGGGAEVNVADETGMTPLMAAADRGDPGIVRALMRRGAQVNAIDHYGNTALITAAARGYVDCVRALLSGGADIRAAFGGHGGWTALHFAAVADTSAAWNSSCVGGGRGGYEQPRGYPHGPRPQKRQCR